MAVVEDTTTAALHELLTTDSDRERVLQLLTATRPTVSDSERLPVVQRLISQGAYQSFGIVLQRFSKDEEICLQAMKSIGWFARDSESVASMVEHNLASLIIRTLRRHVTSAALAVVSISILADSSTNMHFQNLVRIHDGIQAIADVINVHKTNAKILDTSFYCLANLSIQSPDNIGAMIECGCVASIVEGARRYAGERSLVEAALVLVINICRNGASEQKVVADLNGCRALSRILHMAADPDLIKHAFMAIGAFAQGEDNIDRVIDESIVQLMCERIFEYRHLDDGLLEAGVSIFAHLVGLSADGSVVRLIDTHMIVVALLIGKVRAASASVQVTVLQLFLSLYARCAKSQTQLLAMINLLAIPVVLSSIYLFPDQGPISSAAVTLLGAILTDNNARCRLEHVNILPSVVAIGIHQIANPIELRVVLDVLGELATSATITSESLVDTQLLDLLECILTQPEERVSVLEKALLLLQRLVSYGDVGDLVASKLGSTLVSMLNAPFLVKSPSCHSILATCGDIGLNTTGAEFLIQLGILDQALRMLGDESRNAPLITSILECLRKVIRTSLAARATLKEMGAVKMVEALRFQHSADAKATRAANEFLHDVESPIVVSRSKANAKLIGSADAFKLPDLDQNIRLFLCAGGVLTKHCKTAAPRKRHVFLSTDLRFLVWKAANKKPRSLFLDNCEKVASGRSSTELLRESLLFTAASENLSFAVFMKNGRRLSLEAATESLRDQWVKSLDALIRYRQALATATQ